MTSEQKAQKLEAVADWFTDCKNLNLEKLPTGLIEALRDGATALRSLSLIGGVDQSLSEARTGSGQEPCGEKEIDRVEPPPRSQGEEWSTPSPSELMWYCECGARNYRDGNPACWKCKAIGPASAVEGGSQ